MEHALVYHGKFDLNRPGLRSKTRTFIRERDRDRRPLARTTADGIKFGHMEVVPGDDVLVKVDNVTLGVPVRLDRRRHAQGKRGAPSPRLIKDGAARRLLDDALRQNPHLKKPLAPSYARLGTAPPALSTLGQSSGQSRHEGLEDLDLSPSTEGGRSLRRHLAIERDRSLVKRKKNQVQRLTGQFECEACGFDFARKYPALGSDFCEVHHRRGLAARGAARETTLDDLAILCSNCHRMIHRTKSAFQNLHAGAG
ncbi:MAG: HNH endonuclease [Gemmatimonadaceae bacterium]